MSCSIKFRVWQKDKSRFCQGHLSYDGKLHFIHYDSEVKIDGRFGHYIGACTTESWDNYVIEQFTGLQDANGNDIYEGDIVEMAEEFSDCIPEDIDMSDPRIIQFPTDARAGYILRGLHVGQVKFYEGAFRLFGRTIVSRLTRVHGNIHQNPELLK